jgi:hypothetical protein
MPDVNGAAEFGEFWIENKVSATKNVKVEGLWRPSQIAWQTRRSAILTNVWNLVSRPRAGIIEIYSCKKLLDLVTKGSCQPDLILSAPVKWHLLIDHIHLSLVSRAD